MRFVLGTLLFLVLTILLAQPDSRPAHAFDMKLCDYCGRNWDDSPSRIHAIADAHGHTKDIKVCSPFCLCMILKEKDYYELQSTQIVNWDDRGDLQAALLQADSARFLVGVKDKTDKSHDPDVAAFRTDKQLAARKGQLGGSSMSWDKVMEKCRKLAAETDDSEPETYQPLHNRKY